MISIASTDAELEILRPEWVALWERTPVATPFQSPHWLLPWWHHFGTGLPRVAINRRNNQLTGVLPLYILKQEQKLLPIGVGATDYFDVLGEPVDLLESLLTAIRADAVVSCDLVDVQPSSALIGASVRGWSVVWQESTACPVLALPGIPKLARRKLAMSRNRADRAGGWRVEAADIRTVHRHVETLISLHQARWVALGEPGVLADPRVQAFWREAAPALLSAELLRVNSLFVGDKVAAVIAALLAPERIFFYISGFDEAQAFVSPGTILLGAMLEQATTEGRSQAHFLRGRESYKYTWGAVDRFNWSAHFVTERNQR